MAILVTGGAGFIGGHTLQALQREFPSTQIICIDNLSTGQKENIPNGVEFVKGDVCDYPIVNELVKNDPITGNCHNQSSIPIGKLDICG